jgi:serine phosphatase RsbU (regulator of sigma subunit)
MKKIFFILFLFLSFSGKSQVNLDSLWKIWNDPKQPDTTRLIAMSDIAFDGYLFTNPDSAYYFAQLEYDLAKKKNEKKYEAQALGIQGNSFFYKGDYVKAVDYQTRALKIQEEVGNKNGIIASLNNIGNIYAAKSDFANAIIYFGKCLKLSEQIGNSKGMANSLNNIGSIYFSQDNNKKALDYSMRSLKISEATGDKRISLTTLSNIADIYQSLHDYQKTLYYSSKGLALCDEIGDKAGEAYLLNNLGSMYSILGDNEKALDYQTRSLKLREEIGDKNGIAMTLNNIGVIYQTKKDYVKAIDYSKRSLAIAQEIGTVIVIRNSSNALYESYKKTGKYKEAIEMQELYIAERDTILNQDNQKALMKQEMQYDYEKQKALDDKEHEKQIAISSEKEQKQKIVSYIITLGLVLVLFFTLFVINRLHITRKQKLVIESQKELVEEKQKEILDSITYAKRLQDAILPPEQFVKQHFPESFILYKPKDIVAGDFYWMEVASPSPSERGPGGEVIFIAAADCTGHGVPGAMVSVVCSNALNRALLEFGITDPGKILDKTRELVLETFSRSDTDVKDGMDISLISILQTPNSPLLTIKWAGANNPLWYIADKEVKEIKSDKQAIGKTENPQPFTTHTIQLQKGDSLFLFTDGYADQFGGEKGKKFKYKPLKEMLQKNSKFPMQQQKEKLEVAFEEWKKNIEQVDDVCIIGIQL